VDIKENLGQFFGELVHEALRRLGSSVSDRAGVYLIYLLEEMGRRKHDEGPIFTKLFAEESMDKTSLLKEAGDQALFMSGFFRDRLESRGIRVSYYETMGSSAYSQFAARTSRPARELFRELATKFCHFQRVLEDVRTSCDAMDMDYTKAYKLLLQTGSAAAERRLRELGMWILPGNTMFN
jgi:hypothetical protein